MTVQHGASTTRAPRKHQEKDVETARSHTQSLLFCSCYLQSVHRIQHVQLLAACNAGGLLLAREALRGVHGTCAQP
jgi:hypothetical protein